MEPRMTITKLIRHQKEGFLEAKAKVNGHESEFEFLVEEKDDNGNVTQSKKTQTFQNVVFIVTKGTKYLVDTLDGPILLEGGDHVRVDVSNGAGLGLSFIKTRIPEGIQGRQTETDFKTVRSIYPSRG